MASRDHSECVADALAALTALTARTTLAHEEAAALASAAAVIASAVGEKSPRSAGTGRWVSIERAGPEAEDRGDDLSDPPFFPAPNRQRGRRRC